MHYKYSTMHACTYNINIACKKHGKLLLLYAYCCFCRLFHVLSYDNEICSVCNYNVYNTQPPYLMSIM